MPGSRDRLQSSQFGTPSASVPGLLSSQPLPFGTGERHARVAPRATARLRPYREPSAGRWSAPSLRAARRLTNRSLSSLGTKRHLTAYTDVLVLVSAFLTFLRSRFGATRLCYVARRRPAIQTKILHADMIYENDS